MKKKRFIAAAVCPSCKQIDKIFTYLENGVQWRACAACDFTEAQSSSGPAVTEELATRVNQNRLGEAPLAHEVKVEAIKIIDQGDTT